jgi:hypothetical protein
MNRKQKKFLINSMRFVAPTFALFFLQLANGVELKMAFGVAMLAMYQSLSDFFDKFSPNSK